MCYRISAFTLLIFLAGTFYLSAQENYEVRKLTFTGNKTLTKSVLLENMAMEEVSWPEKLVFKREPYLYSQELLAPDLDRVKRIYQSKGFLHVQVSLDRLNVNHKKQTVKVWIAIVE
ncbi:MAG: POTRA domain-containing protein [Mariniphaga sp.]|nr:POTRA domain-containing protein [Mariniphaga sp.]